MKNYLDSAPCLYFSSSDDGTILEVNETLCSKLGYTKEELTGKKLDLIFTLATRIFQQTHFFPLVKLKGSAGEIFITLRSRSGEEVPVLINAERQVKGKETIIVHIGIEVYNRKKFEDELVAAKRAAESALHENTALAEAKKKLQEHTEQLDQQIRLVKNQNEELKQFNRIVTHDLQEPLRKISVFSNLLLQPQEREQQVKTVEKLSRVKEHMASIVSGLQQYIWLTEASIKKTKIDLNKLLLVAKQQVESDFPGIGIRLDSGELPLIDADREQVQLLFYHLLSNAVRFRKTGEAPTVIVSADRFMRNIFRNLKDKYHYGEHLRLSISDKGTGFDAIYKDQAFELFKRLHAESGRGIGLALCKKIVENHHGEIEIDSQPDVGTTVTVILPMDQPAPDTGEAG